MKIIILCIVISLLGGALGAMITTKIAIALEKRKFRKIGRDFMNGLIKGLTENRENTKEEADE